MPEFVQWLESELRDVPVPPAQRARDQAIERAREEIGRRAPSEVRSRTRPRWLAPALGLLVVIAIGFTPPGQAAAEWLEDLILGGDDTRPQDHLDRVVDAVAVGAAVDPAGRAYEVLADLDSDQGLCVYFQWSAPPVDAKHGFGGCGARPAREGTIKIPFVSAVGGGTVAIAGIAPPGAGRIDVAYPAAEGRVRVRAELFGIVPTELDSRLTGRRWQSVAVFVSFLPQEAGAPNRGVDLTAFRSDGTRLTSRALTWIEVPVAGQMVVVPCTSASKPAGGSCNDR